MLSEKGNVAVFALTFFLLCSAGILLIVVSRSGWTSGRVFGFGGTAFLAALLLLFEWRSDRYAVTTFITGMLGMAAVVSVITTFSLVSYDEKLSTGWLSVSAMFTLAATSLGVYLYRLKKRPEDPRFPNVLRREFGDKMIMERDGIQMVTAVLTDEAPAMFFLVQNCWVSERKVRLTFDTGNIHIGKPDPLLPVRKVDVELAPAEVAKVVVPVRPSEKPFCVYAGVAVSGSGGTRVRLWEARSISARITPGRSVLGLFAGVLAWGGGIKFKFPTLSLSGTLSEPEVTPVWRPNPEDTPVVPM